MVCGSLALVSTQPALPAVSAAPPAYPRAPAKSPSADGELVATGLSVTGVVLFVTGLLVVGSGHMSLRPEVMGLRVHPFLLPVAAAFPLVVLARITEFPVRVLAAMLTFCAMYWFSVLQGSGSPVNEIFKVASTFITMLTCALLVRRRGDFVAGALGLSIAVALLAWPALNQESSTQLEVMDGANKNSYSLFALPALLLAGYIATRMRTVPMAVKATLVACTLPTIVVIFMSANRSGYLGCVVVGFLLFWDRRGRGMLVVAAVAGAVVLWMSNYGDTRAFDERMKLTVEGSDSDSLRIEIILASIATALENPIMGVSPNDLPLVLGRRLDATMVDPHNVFGHVAAGSGLICFVALVAVGVLLFFWHPRDGRKIGGKEDPLRAARTLLRMMLILWVVRGFFSREILYNPSFAIGMGLCIGLCMLAEKAKPPARATVPMAIPRGANAG